MMSIAAIANGEVLLPAVQWQYDVPLGRCCGACYCCYRWVARFLASSFARKSLVMLTMVKKLLLIKIIRQRLASGRSLVLLLPLLLPPQAEWLARFSLARKTLVMLTRVKRLLLTKILRQLLAVRRGLVLLPMLLLPPQAGWLASSLARNTLVMLTR
ncbi:hypothetical protein LSAT2_016048 [Lamellibrachia satsuma]|nr:hypothetical protein LSAT2_016048 [Lamellibrachia satsuma]